MDDPTTPTWLPVALAIVAALLGVAYLALRSRTKTRQPLQQQDDAPPALEHRPAQDRAQGRAHAADRTGLGRLNRRAAAAAREATAAAAGDDNDHGADEDDLAEDDGDTAKKMMGAKKAEKMRRKEEERRQRELLAAQREDAKKREALRDEERRKRKEEEDRLGKEVAEEEAKRLADIARQEEEEYQRLRQDIVVEQAGVEQKSIDEVQDLLVQIAEYVRTCKVVTLEELSSEFSIRMQDAVRWLKELDGTGKITGVLDDRGKYIYISEDEMRQVADFVQKRGRVSRSELAAMSNKLIDLKGHRRKANVEGVFDNLMDESPAEHP